MDTRNRKELREMLLVHGVVLAVVAAGFLSTVTARVLLSIAQVS